MVAFNRLLLTFHRVRPKISQLRDAAPLLELDRNYSIDLSSLAKLNSSSIGLIDFCRVFQAMNVNWKHFCSYTNMICW